MRKAKRIFSLLLAAILAVSAVPWAYAAPQADALVIYPEYDERIPRDYMYSVSVSQGTGAPQTIPVYNRNNSGTLFTERMENPDFQRRFCEFSFSGGPVTVHITPHCDFTRYTVMPSAKQYPSSFSDGTISVTVTHPDETFLLKLDGDDNSILCVFADAPEAYAFDPDDPSVLYVDEKWAVCANRETLEFHETSRFEKSTDENGDTVIRNVWGGTTPVTTLYVAPGCVLNARIFTWYPGITVCGHGMLLDPYSDIFRTDITSAARKRLAVIESGGCTVRDLKLVDAQHYNLAIGTYGSGCTVENLKILSATISTDGISVFGADDVTVRNCFVYCGDNAFVFGERNENNRYENNIIGTPCAAFCPQENLPYDLLIRNSYVFRCDEGCVNYWYCSGETAVANVTFDTLDCADVNSIPWLFNSRDAGFAEKTFTFKNVSLRNVRGHKTLVYPPNGKTVILNVRHTALRDSGNYRLTLENVFVDGTPLTSYADLKIDNPVPADNTVDVHWDGGDPVNIAAAPAVCSVRSVYPFKVYIGDSLQRMRTQPVMENGTVYLPYGETLEKLGLPETPNPAPVTVNGAEMISVSDFSARFSPAQYHAETGEIRIANAENTAANLLEEHSSCFSRWVEAAAYLADLTARKENDAAVYCIKELRENSDDGMITFVTDEIKKNGPARYVMTFYAKTVGETSQTGCVKLREHGGAFDLKTPLNFGPEWKAYTVTFDIPAGTELRSCRDFYILVANDSVGGFDVEVRDICMRVSEYHHAAPQEPATEPTTEPATQPPADPPQNGSGTNFWQRIVNWFRHIFDVIRGWFGG